VSEFGRRCRYGNALSTDLSTGFGDKSDRFDLNMWGVRGERIESAQDRNRWPALALKLAQSNILEREGAQPGVIPCSVVDRRSQFFRRFWWASEVSPLPTPVATAKNIATLASKRKRAYQRLMRREASLRAAFWWLPVRPDARVPILNAYNPAFPWQRSDIVIGQ
jgi:hypothetical protein